MGFDGLFFGRLDHQDKDKRQVDKTMEFLWQASANLGDLIAFQFYDFFMEFCNILIVYLFIFFFYKKKQGIDAELFTGALPNRYSAPGGFNFDVFSSDEPIKVTETLFLLPI